MHTKYTKNHYSVSDFVKKWDYGQNFKALSAQVF